MNKNNELIAPEYLRYFNMFNFGLIGLIVILVGMIFLFQFLVQKDTLMQTKLIIQRPSIVPELKFSKKHLADYDKILSKNEIFAAQSGVKGKNSVFFAKSTEALLEQLELAGIISGPQGSQAIINDLISNKSVYCRKGDIVGGFVVKKVESDKVILGIEEEEVELRL